MRKTILFIASILLFGGVFAQNVPFQDAQRAAEGLFALQQKRLSHCVDVAVSGSDTLYYVFNAENGFAVIAADRRVPPVLAFSDREPFRPGEVIPPVKMWLDHYRTQLAELKAQPAGLQAEHPAWARLARGGRPLRDEQHFVEPLVRSHWGQGKFYNYYCPEDFSGENNHVVTGCVATAMAQLIYYFRFPETGIGSYSYTDENYGVQSADYGATHYNYEAMCDKPTAINPDICTLMHHCGVGVDMVYGPDGSGMYNHSAARVLRTFFKYNPATEYLFRDSTQLDWDSVIVWHLERRIPMYYAGWSNPNINGHGFLCDGYQIVDSAYYYHFNFGWDGSSDNYFYTDHLNLVGTHFNLAQELIVNCYPDTAQYPYPTPQPTTGVKTMTALAGSFTDGSAEPDHCRPAMDYLWHIVPDADTLESITLDIQYTLAEGDTLWISPNCVNTFYMLTADTDHFHQSWPCTEVSVRFVTGASTLSDGFRANYTTALPQYCAPVTVLSNTSGQITDGSGDNGYTPFSYCKYRIVQSSYDALILYIHELDLEPGQASLRIYKRPASGQNLLAEYTGTMSDTMVIFNEKRLDIIFESDAHGYDGGFDLTYEGSPIGVESYEESALHLWPNPSSQILHIASDTPIRQVEAFDLQGRRVWSSEAHDLQCDIPVADWSDGLYFVKISTKNQTITRKILKQDN